MPGFDYDGTGIPEGGGNGAIPEGTYILEITHAKPGKTGNGDPKVTVHYRVAEGDFKGKKVMYHTVTFFRDKTAKGAGIAIHYVKSIGQPFEGAFRVEPEAWVGKKLKAQVEHEEYNGYTNAKVKFVDPVDGTSTPAATAKAPVDDLEDAPF